MGGTQSIAGIGQAAQSSDTAGTATDALDTKDSTNHVVVVDTSGAATLTVEFSTTGDFSGEERALTIDYDSAQSDQFEQFGLPHRYVRASVNQNLNEVEVVKGGV
jgi:hypothetical protein